MTVQADRSSGGRNAIGEVTLLRDPGALRVTRVLQAFTFSSVRKQTPSHRAAAERLLADTPGLPQPTVTALADRLWSDYPTRANVWAKVCATAPPGWTPAIAVELATANPLLDAPELSTGMAQVRIDALLDVLESDRSGHDIQREWMQIMTELRDHARSDTERVTGKGSDLLGGILGRFGSTLMEVGVEQGLNLIQDFSATHTVIVDDLARMVLAVRAGVGDLDRALVGDLYRTLVDVEHAISRDIGDVKRRGNTSYEANRHLLLVRATLDMIQEASGQSPGDFTEPIMPEVLGMRLPDAMHLLRSLGIPCRHQATAGPAGNIPSVRVPKNWVVSAQAPGRGQRLGAHESAVLEVTRFGGSMVSASTPRPHQIGTG